ncbi:16S rRNA (uracil(1498)-N(3))-methyltransferase [Candidatus Endobugula sertula]|uniref:Ribosomal RNA small subunit methyltransferase E n=1 Tax=Candidatus Endobugula sertula TaxID=62101 RepID=A0A1D2QQ54_9GAMM|nr:16S rRNA (uracil(1498)-N(3))-methyltransferase [Candidatus Endobugula sertula]
MNLILLLDTDFIADNCVKLYGRRFEHIRTVHQVEVGSRLNVGLLNGSIGTGLIEQIDNQQVILTTSLDVLPPPRLPINLIIALPRPKMLKRILQTCATMGVKKIIFLNSYRVEKSYWQTPLLSKEKINEQLILGLEQAKDTILPEIILEKQFKPFVEDHLPTLCKETISLVAHPESATRCPYNLQEPATLVIGPEGGLIPYEIRKLNQAGCKSVHVGERILRVETAVTSLLTRLYL